MMRHTIDLAVAVAVSLLAAAAGAAAGTESGVLVGYCNSAGAGVVELGPPATPGGADYPKVTLPGVSHISIANGAELAVKVGDNAPSKEPLTEFDLADKAAAGGFLVVSTTKDGKVLGLIVAVVDDSGIKVGRCATRSGFNAIKARVGALSAIVNGKLGNSSNVLTVSSVIGMSRVGGTDEDQAKQLGKSRAMRIAGAAAESVSLPTSRLGPQASDFRLLGYTEYTTIELPSTAATAPTAQTFRAAGTDFADAYRNSSRTHDIEFGLLYRLDPAAGWFSNPDTTVSLRLGFGGSTLRTVDSSTPDGLVMGHSPWFYAVAARFESDYETWGDGSTTRGMVEAGFERYGPFGEKERDRWVVTGALYLPALQAGTKAAVYAYIRLDFPRKGDLENHRVGIMADVNLASFLSSGGS